MGGYTPTVFAEDIAAATIGDVDLTFCNTDNLLDHNRHLKLQMDPNKSKEMCLEFINTTDYDVPLKVNFVDGGLTADQDARRACKNEISKDGFGKYVQGDLTTVTVPAKSSTKLMKTLTMPASKVGYNYGCVTYSVPDGKITKQGGLSYNVVVRKAGFIDAIVKGKIISRLDVLGPEGRHNVAYAESSYQSGSLIAGAIGVKEYEDYVEVYTILKNSGNVPLLVSGKGSMKDLLGKTIQLGTGGLSLLPDESKSFHLTVPKPVRWHFQATMSGEDMLNVPWYRMHHNAIVDISYTPDIPGDNLNLSDYSGTYHLGGTIFLMPWRLIILLAMIAVGIITRAMMRRNRKRREQKMLQKIQSQRETL
ncbi:MAG: hypothetical protein WC004_04425 [Candidatus Absconditabacterales bacterium]